MYKIKCDDLTLYNPLKKDLFLGSPVLNLEVNKAGSLSFLIYPTHNYYGSLSKLKSVITVYQDSRIVFKGRVYSDLVNFRKVKKVEVEGLLAYFNDSIVRPYEFTGSVTEYVTYLINQHNNQVTEDQRFKVGRVTVTDPNDYITRANSSLPKTWNEIEEKLIKLLGGYICIRYEDDGNYIDYLADFTDTSTQEVKFAVNLLDLENAVKGDSLATCIIPYGAKITSEGGADTEERVTITSVNNGVDYIQNDEAVSRYGKIYEVVTWDDVTDPSNLLSKARAYLTQKIMLSNSLTIKAVDLNLVDSKIEAFKLGDYIRVYSKPHDIDETILLQALTVDISKPSTLTFTLGVERSSLVDSNNDKFSNADIKIESTKNELKEYESSINTEFSGVRQTITEESSSAVTTAEAIIFEALKSYTETSNFNSFKETVESELKVLADKMTLTFTETSEELEKVNGNLQNQINSITKYFTFDINGMTIGQSDSPYKVVIDNDRYSMTVNDEEIFWVANGKVYTPEIEIAKGLKFFGYSLSEDTNGNVNCNYVGGGE